VPEPADRAETSVSTVSAPKVRIRYWAAARAAAGVADEVVEARTVADALAAARAAHTGEPRFATILSVCSFLLAEAPLGTRDLAHVAIVDGDILDVLPPFAGG
jgi:sulfur-carrier protein